VSKEWNVNNNQIPEVFTTCLSSTDVDAASSLRKIVEIAQWSEHQGCRGILVYTDNKSLDPWLVAQVIIEHTMTLCPLVAVQPIYMHPYSIAKMIASLAHLYRRRVYLNMVAGGFKNDLIALNDSTPHEKRYERLIEYTEIIKRLLAGGAVTSEGEFYKVDKLKLTPPVPEELMPGIFVSGSSDAGQEAARRMNAIAVEYPKPPKEYETSCADTSAQKGIRIGIIARSSEEEAWQIAHERFPEDRKGQLTHQLAMKSSDSQWHRQLSEREDASQAGDDTYWLVPFQNYKAFCPYLVGSYDRVAGEVANYMRAGYGSFILDIPVSEAELNHINTVFRVAEKALQLVHE
jgi:alkanesulfonate monooxygenase